MKRLQAILPLFILITSLATWRLARAQSEEEITLSLSRDFGYSSGGGDIQGTFSMRVTAPENVNRVAFLIDGQVIGEDSEPPFKLQFQTESYALGKHTLSAMGYTIDGRQLKSNEFRLVFVTAEEGWQAALKIVVPILGLVLGITVFSFLIPILTGRGKKNRTPLGQPRQYGFKGGTICPKCARPFSFSFFSFNLLLYMKFDRCPHCGRMGIFKGRPLAELRAAEALELEGAQGTSPVNGLGEAEKLRKELEDSRFQDV